MERRLAAILAADVVGFSRMMGSDEVGTLDQLKLFRENLFIPKEAQYHGHTIKLMGDGVLMEFGSVVDAVLFAVEIQFAIVASNINLPPEKQIIYRIGINIGDIIAEEDDIFGDGVNIASRLEALAEPGGIVINRNVHNQVRDKLLLDFNDLGEFEVKNIDRPLNVFRIVLNEKAKQLVTPIKFIPTEGRFRVLPVIATLVLSAVVVAGLLFWQPLERKSDKPPEPNSSTLDSTKPTLAVLPFANLGGDREREYFADGLTTDLITDLSKVSGLFVIARNSVFAYKDQAVKIQEVADELGVRYVLEGSVRQSGTLIRINAQLIDTSNGNQLWAERYNGSLEDIFALQDNVLRQIVSALEVRLTDSEERQITDIPTKNLEAYDNFLRAEQSAYGSDIAKLTEAIGRYKRAINLDPEFAEAYAGLSRTYAYVLRQDFGNVVIGPVAREGAYSAASKAVKLNPSLAQPLSVLGIIQMIDGEHANAVETSRRAVAMAQNDSEAHINLALVLGAAGEPEEAVKNVEIALRLNPNPPPGFLILAGLTFYLNRDLEKAIQYLEKARAVAPKSVDAYEYLLMAHAQMGNHEKAKELQEYLLKVFDVGYSLSAATLNFDYYKRKEDREYLLDGLRKGGLPNLPFGFEGAIKDRLNRADIVEIAQGQTWNGRFLKAEPFFMSFDNNGSFALRTQNTIRVGSSKIQNAELCLKSPSQFLGRWSCGPVYRNPQVSSAGNNLYIYASGLWFFEFRNTE